MVATPTPRPPVKYALPLTESSCEGVVVPMPISPNEEVAVEIENTGMLEVEVAME